MSSEGIISRAEMRSDHHSILIDDVLYTWGGDHPNLPAVHDSLWKREWRSKIETFQISTGRWTIRPTTGSPPLGVIGYSCSIIDDYKIAFFGGWCGHGSCYYNSLHQLDIKEFNWTQLSHPPDDIMKRAYGGMITIEDDDGIKLLMIGGRGSPPTIPHQQFQYVKLSRGDVRTNEINMFTPSSGKWTTPTMIGDVMPPNNGFTINKITKSRAIIFGGAINEGVTTNDMYIMEIINSTVHWQNIKSSQSIGQWPKGRYGHASSIISSSVLVVLGGVDQNNQPVNDKCLWLYSINQLSWTKINLPDTVSGRHFHSLSSLMIGPHCVWLVVLGGRLQPEKKTIDGVDEWTADYVSSPNISMIIELMFSDGDWSLGFILDEDNSIHLLELIFKERMKQNPSNDESSLEEDNPLKELKQSLHHDLETSQQTIKSLQEALLDTKEELNKQMIEKDSHIAKMTRKVTEGTIVNELEEKVKELTSEVERLREKKQVDDNNPPIDGSTDDITLELVQKNAELTKELESLKKQIEYNKCSINSTQLVHDNESQFTSDDVSKLMVILQPVEDDWYQLGHHLDIEESTLSDVKQLKDSCTVQMEHLLQRWCREGGTLMKLEEALTSMDRTDLISGLRQLKSVTKMDVSVQFNYMTPSIDRLDYLSEVHKAETKLFVVQGDGPQLLNWEEYGLRISVVKGTLLPSETAEIAVVALVGGQFKFPKGTQLVSAIYAISVSKPVNEPLRVDMQHCVNITRPSQTRNMKFAIAPVNTPSLPYQFEVMEGGEFAVNSFYGSIHRLTFCLLGILAGNSSNPGPDDPPVGNGEGQDEEDPSSSSDEETNGHESQNGNASSDNEEDNGSTSRDDESQTHGATPLSTTPSEEIKSKPVTLPVAGSDKSSNDDSVELVYVCILFDKKTKDKDLAILATTKDLNVLLKYVKTNHSQADMDNIIPYSFQSPSDYIELIFDDERQKDPCTGWIIRPLQEPCQLFKKHIDKFGSISTPVPASCSISVCCINSPDTVPVLNYGIPLEGIDPSKTVYIHRKLMETSTNIGTPLEATPSSSSVHQSTSLQPSFTLPSSVTRDQLRSVVRQLRQVLDGNQVVLDNLFRQNIQSISRELRQVGILPNDPHQTHSYDAIITCFEIGLSLRDDTRDFEVYCNKFISSLANVGGPCTDAAEMIIKKWNASLQNCN